MKIKELIEKLKLFSDDAFVVIEKDDNIVNIRDIEILVDEDNRPIAVVITSIQ